MAVPIKADYPLTVHYGLWIAGARNTSYGNAKPLDYFQPVISLLVMPPPFKCIGLNRRIK